MDLLDEEMKLPKPSEMHFTTEAHKQNASHFRLVVSYSGSILTELCQSSNRHVINIFLKS